MGTETPCIVDISLRDGEGTMRYAFAPRVPEEKCAQ